MEESETSTDFARLVGADALLAAQRDVLEMIVRNEPLVASLDALCRIVEAHADEGTRASLLLVDQKGETLYTAAAPSLPAAYTKAIDGIAIAEGIGTCVAAAASGSVVVTTDIAAAPGWAEFRALPLGLGLVAAWSLPIMSSTGAVLGTFGTYFTEKRAPTAWERMIVEVLARTAALAIERERSDRALRESEARYRTIVEASPECVKLVSADGRLLQMNPAGLHMVGATEADVIGADVYRIIAVEHRQRYRQFHERVCAGKAGTIAYDIVLDDGTRRSMESVAVPLRHHDGFAQLALTRDVTERRSAEHALAVQRSRLDYAARAAGIGFWYCDLPFDELIWDDRVKEHFFFPPDARITIEDFYERIHPDDRQPTRDAIDRSIERNESYDVVYRTVDPRFGAIKWIRALGGTAYAADGTPVRFDGVTVDVTAHKRDERRLAALNERLREQDRRKDDFLATLAHELRNPLAALKAGLEILARTDGDARTSATRDMMSRQLTHLVHMVDDLLDLSRITHGKVELRRERLDIREPLRSAVEATRQQIEAAGIDLVLDLSEEALPLDADATRLAQVLTNILHNSIKYTPPGGRITLTTGLEGGSIVARVSDTGAGIPRDELASIFDVFFQAGRPLASGNQGLGIGLTLVRMFVELHGGTVEALSDGPGEGSTFEVRLPLAAGKMRAADAAPAHAEARETLSRVLVIDDNVDAAESLAVLLDLFGHDTAVAHSGSKGLELADETMPEAAIVDIGLPDISGYEIAERLRADSRFEGIRLIALTGWGTEADRRRAHAAGFDHHLVKPVSVDALRAALETGRN